MLKAIIFDMDGVVIDTEPVYLAADKEFFGRQGVKDDPEVYCHFLTGRSLDDGTQLMQDMYGFPGKPEQLLAERLATIKKYYKGIEFIPGFLDFFAKVKTQYATGIATSSNLELFAIADSELHLSQLLNQQVFFLKDVNNIAKPAPDIFLHAAKMLGAEPANCLVVEDAVNGIKAAKQAGMKCLALATSHDASLLGQADRIVNNYDEINLEDYND